MQTRYLSLRLRPHYEYPISWTLERLNLSCMYFYDAVLWTNEKNQFASYKVTRIDLRHNGG